MSYLSRHATSFDTIDRIILEWTTSLDTSSRTLFVREDVHVTSNYVITSDCY